MVRLDLETWRRALPGWTLRLVNDSNIGEFVPDLPDEYYRLPYTQVKSDVLRAAVLYHHGGLYLDTDFVVSPRIAEAVELVEAKTADVVTYGNGKEHICDTSHFSAFASNFMLTRAGNPFSMTWWVNTKDKLTRKCKEGEYVDSVEKVCCHEEGKTTDPAKKCHIPWGYIEHLKLADRDGPGQSKLPLPVPGARLHCYNGEDRDNFMAANTPMLYSTFYRRKSDMESAGVEHGCYEDEAGTLTCLLPRTPNQWNPSPILTVTRPNLFKRIAYHLFSSVTPGSHKSLLTGSTADLLASDIVLGELYRRVLGVHDST